MPLLLSFTKFTKLKFSKMTELNAELINCIGIVKATALPLSLVEAHELVL